MARTTQVQWQFALQVEEQLQAKLKDKNPLFDEVEHLIDQLRIACENVLFLDFDFAVSEKVEARLWDAHSTINNRYRKIVSTFKARDMRTHVVEKRKWEKRYVDFLKKSQYFYKGYIQRLASHFDGVHELRRIAHRLHLDTLTADPLVRVSGQTSRHILLSCHATLLRLGDLSRYRNVIRIHDRSWDKALAYYGLANDLYPDSGNGFNQMAVISLSEGDHLNAVYHLYRSLAVKEPNPMAEGNLEIEFKKIENEWESGARRSAPPSRAKTGNVAAPVISWFVRLHAKLYKGDDFSAHDEMENEVLGQLTVLLKEQSLEGILDRFVLVNIAAEFFAAERLKGNPIQERFQSYYFFLRLNIRTLFMLLQLLQTELAQSTESDDVPDVTRREKINVESITAVTRRILASVRQYSIWLVSSAVIITGQDRNAPLNVHIKELWSLYCSTLTLLVSTFPPEHLAAVEYLLEEDAETVGFIPFRDTTYCDPYTTELGLKPRTTDKGIERQHPNIEMLSRFRDLERDAMILSTSVDKDGKKIAPITVVHGEFHFIEDGLPLSSSVDGRPSEQSISNISPKSAVPVVTYIAHHPKEARAASVAASDSHQSMGTEMYLMVDALVAPCAAARPRQAHLNADDETSYGMHSSTAAEIFAPIPANGRPPSGHATTPFKNLPGIVTTPFSPQPGELSGASPIPPGTATRLPPLFFSDTPNNSDSPSPNGGSNRLSWGNKPVQTFTQRQATQQLHESLARQYGTAPLSSGFSNTSSLYGGTPMNGTNVPRHFSAYQNQPPNASTKYVGESDFDRATMLQSSLWNGSQPLDQTHTVPTPPGGQGV